MLFNNATPKYYARFRDAVLRGKIPVCEEISLEMNRIDERIANPDYFYDPGPVEGFIKYCEAEMTQTDGSDIVMLESFKLWIEQVLGWYYFVERRVYIPKLNGRGGSFKLMKVKKRLISKQFLIVARGAAKSMYGSFIHSYFLNVFKKTTHQITTAPTMRQADEVVNPIKTAITISKGPLFKVLTEGSIHNTTGKSANRPRLAATKRGIENLLTNSLLEVRPMTINKLQGLRPFVSTVDEWLSGDTREDVIGAIEQGASKMEDYLIVAMSSEGTVRNGSGDDIKMELMSILRGDYKNPHVSIFYYKLDDVKEVGDPSKWVKANPNLGITVSYETYQRDVERATSAPSTRNDILAKRFGIPMEGYTYFFTYEETIRHRNKNYDGMPCALGADLSRGDDFCAFTFLFSIRQGFGLKTLCFITKRTLHMLAPSMRIKYEEFIEEGSLVVLEGSVLDMDEVYEQVDEYILEHEYDIRAYGYDPYNAKTFMDRWTRENGEHGVVKVIQGAKTESVPLGEPKKLSEDRRLVFDQKLFEFTMGNTMVLEDTSGNKKLYKRHADAKIDSVSAMLDAYVAFKANTGDFG